MPDNYENMEVEELKEDALVEDEFLEELIEETDETEEVKPRIGVVVPARGLNIRHEANTNSEIIEILSKGDKVNILNELDADVTKWFHVLTEYGADGYCMKEFIEEE